MGKVKVSREEANAFENLKQVIAKRKGSDETSQLVLGFAEMAAGYEVEQTPEKKVKEYFDTWNEPIDGISNSDWTSEQKAIIGTLNRLNIKVSGVNM